MKHTAVAFDAPVTAQALRARLVSFAATSLVLLLLLFSSAATRAAQSGPYTFNPLGDQTINCSILNAIPDNATSFNGTSFPAGTFAGITSNFGFKTKGGNPSQPPGQLYLTSAYGELTGGAPEDPNNWVEFTFTNGLLQFNWQATLGIDAVIVKSQDPSNVYVYTPEAFSGTGLQGPSGVNNVSHIEICYDYNLTVEKTATTTFTRTWQWKIEKTVTPTSINMFTGDSSNANYTVTVTKDGYTDSDWAVSGDIIIGNDTPLDATITSITDVISGPINAPVTCPKVGPPISFPYVLPKFNPANPTASELVCSYTAALPDGTNRTNTATANTTGTVQPGEGTAAVTFGASTTEVNATIHVTDSVAGSLGAFSDSGSTTYQRTFTCDADQGTKNNTATIVETGQSASASVTVNCYRLNVTKTANTSYRRTYDWTIVKSVTPTDLKLAIGQSYTVNYTVVVSATTTDDLFVVSGNISVQNPAPIPATLNSISDVISGVGSATVNCGVAFPYTLAAGGTLSCSYSAALPNKTNRTNTATATLQNSPSGTTSFTGSANVVFNGPTSEVDKCVNVTDTLGGSLGQFCANGALTKTYTYPYTVGPYATCGNYNVANTASFTTNNTGTTGSSTANVKVVVDCPQGCTLTQGYWKNHAGIYGLNKANKDEVSKWLPIVLGNISVNTVTLAVKILNYDGGGGGYYSGGSDNGLNKLLGQLLAAKLNIAAGANGSSIASAIAAADSFLAQYSNWGALSKTQQQQVLAWKDTFDKFNMGVSGPGKCTQ